MKMKRFRLGELIKVTRGISLNGQYFSSDGEHIRLTLGNFDYHNNCFKEDKSKDNLNYTGKMREDFILNEGDIITPLTEQAVGLLGSTAKIPCSGKYIQSQDVGLVKCSDVVDSDYIFYLISSSPVKKQLSVAAQQTKIRHTSPDKIHDCIVWVPEYARQVRIGKILTALDNKIALNRRMNITLEQMAKRLYDYWFVQFDFPNANGKPYKSSGGKMVWNEMFKREIPEGWDVKRLGDIVSKIDSGRRPNGGIDKSLKTGIPSLGAECIDRLGCFDFSATPFVDERYRNFMTSGRIEDNDILIYKDGAYVGKATLFRDGFPYDEAYVNEHVFLVHPSASDFVEYLYFVLDSQPYFNIMQNLGKTKAAQPGLNREDLRNILLIVPDDNVMKGFHNIIEALFAEIFSNAKCSGKLTALRDHLLPLLMNGQIEIE